MKKINLILKDASASPLHLLFSLLFSLYVMEFVNLFIGSMGGIPAFMGVFVTSYLFSIAVKTDQDLYKENTVEKQKIKTYFISYVVWYGAVWVAMKIVLFFSKFSGWGNVKKLNVGQYIKGIYGTTLSECWAYVFTALLMFAFVISLFPLIFIKNRKIWFEYVIADSVVHAALCVITVVFSRIFIKHTVKNKARCVLDDLLACEIPQWWKMALYIVSALLLVITELYLIYKMTIKIGGAMQEKSKKRSVKISTATVCIFFLLCSVGAGTIVFFLSPVEEEETDYKRVARCLTDDSVMGPMVYKSEVYVPIRIELDYDENGMPLGYVGYKGQDCNSRFYRMAVANMLYTDKKNDGTYMQLSGADSASYKKMSVIEKVDSWKRDNVFLLWDEDWESESTYSKDVTGYAECEKQLVESLENTFGEVKINPQDFKDYDAYFTIESYPTMKDAVEGDNQVGTWIGCILVKDNKFYYGNYNNQIKGVPLQKLLNVLGGY